MKTIRDVTLQDIREIFDSTIFARGEEYFDEGFVESVEQIDADSITGTVRGNQLYTVSVMIDEERNFLCDCSCP